MGAARSLSLVACLALWLGSSGLAPAQPANDDFAGATTLTGPSGSVTGSTVGATTEPGEPAHAFNFGGASIWFSWQAPISGDITIDTGGSDFDTLLGIYTGSSVMNLTLVANNDDLTPGVLLSKVQFAASAGTTYRIAIDGYNGGFGAEFGDVVLTWARQLEILTSGPLTRIATGPDGSFQVYHASFANGQAYHPDFAPADAGFFVRHSDGMVNGLNLFNRDTAAEGTFALSFYPVSQSMSQDGLEATIVMDNRNDGTTNQFQVTQVTRYRPGDEFFVVEHTVQNQGVAPFTADYFAAGDLYLADNDLGFGFERFSSGVVGGSDIGGVYHIFLQNRPGNPPVLFQEAHYGAIWAVIGTPGLHFDNTIRSDYLDNGAGLEWQSVTLAPGASVKIAYNWAFGSLSDLAVSLTAPPEPVNVGSQLTYSAVVTNVGTGTVTNAMLTDVLPSGLSFVSASSSIGSCMNQGGTIECSLGNLASNQAALVTILVQATTAGMITNTVTVSGHQADVDLANNAAVAQVTVLGDTAPVLSIRAVGPNVVLSWQATCPSCVLKQVAQFNPPIQWLSVGAPVMTVNGTNEVTLPRGTNNRFFQLGPGP